MPSASFKSRLVPSLAALCLVAVFKANDFYHRGFDQTGFSLLLYNFERGCYGLLLLFAALCAGSCITKPQGTPLPETSATLLKALFSGMCLINLAVFVLGVFHGIHFWLIAPLGFLLLAAGSSSALNLLADFARAFRSAAGENPVLLYGGILLLSPAAIVLFLMKGVFPAGGHDYWNHYFHYYVKVVERGNFGPNEVWYHFYYSKGAGLYFALMSLGDFLMPSVVTFCLVFIIGAALADLVVRFAGTGGRSYWFIAPILYFFLMSFTPGIDIFRNNGGWGDFEKLHEYGSFFIIGTFWLILRDAGETDHPSPFALLRLSLVLLSCTVAILADVFLLAFALFLLCLLSLALRRWALLRVALFSLALLGTGTLGVLAYNYAVTGMPSDLGIVEWWPWADLGKIDRCGMTLPALQLLQVYSLAAHPHGLFTPLPFSHLHFLLLCFRADLLAALLTLALLGALIAAIRQAAALLPLSRLGLVTACFALSFAICCLLGAKEYISTFRLTGCEVSIWIAFAVATLAAAASLLPAAFRLPSACGTLLLSLGCIYLHGNPANFKSALTGSAAFLTGRHSIAYAFRHQDGLPGRMPGGALHPGTEQVLSTLPLDTRVWSFHVHTYSVRPGRLVESIYSYNLSPHFFDFPFETADQVEATLRQEHLNYFLLNTHLVLGDDLHEIPLFAPDAVAQHFGLAASSGDTYLLTWKDQARAPIPPDVLAVYRKACAAEEPVRFAPYIEPDVLRHIHDLYLDAQAAGRSPDPVAVRDALLKPAPTDAPR